MLRDTAKIPIVCTTKKNRLTYFCSLWSPYESIMWAKEFPRQITASNPLPTSSSMSSYKVNQFASSITTKNAFKKNLWAQRALSTPLVECRFFSSVPSGFQRVLQHLIGSVHRNDFEAFFEQHNGIDSGKYKLKTKRVDWNIRTPFRRQHRELCGNLCVSRAIRENFCSFGFWNSCRRWRLPRFLRLYRRRTGLLRLRLGFPKNVCEIRYPPLLTETFKGKLVV